MSLDLEAAVNDRGADFERHPRSCSELLQEDAARKMPARVAADRGVMQKYSSHVLMTFLGLVCLKSVDFEVTMQREKTIPLRAFYKKSFGNQ